MPITEHDLAFEGSTIHCYEGGSGYPILLIHGSGPGTASASNWARVLEPLSQRYHVLAMDLIGYGRSGRKKREPYFDLDLWVRQGRFVIDHLAPKGPVGVIGHSLGGGIALRLALKDKRVAKLLLQGSLGAKLKLNMPIRVSWTPPKSLAAFRRFYKSVIKVRGDIPDDFLRERLAVMEKDAYADYFAKMFKGNKQRYLNMTRLTAAQLKRLKCEVVMVHGAEDTCVPFEEGGLPLADMLPQADLVRLADCGHPCSFDQPGKFMQVAHNLFS